MAIMTVDDSASLRQMVSFTLSNAGYEVVEAVDGVDALSKLESVEVNLLMVDISMPRMEGIELVRTVRTMPRYKYIPIVILTTETSPEMRKKARIAGATAWMVKPFKVEQLLSVVEKVLRQAGRGGSSVQGGD